MTETTTLAAKLAKVILELPGFTKDGRNSHQGYNFISIEQMKKTIIPALAAQGIVCYPHSVRETINTRDRGSELYVVMKWIITDGDEILEPHPETIGQAADTQDKSGSKGTTDALKNLFKTTFGVYEKDDDNDRNTPFPENEYYTPAPPVESGFDKAMTEARNLVSKLAVDLSCEIHEVVGIVVAGTDLPDEWESSADLKTENDLRHFIDAATNFQNP